MRGFGAPFRDENGREHWLSVNACREHRGCVYASIGPSPSDAFGAPVSSVGSHTPAEHFFKLICWPSMAAAFEALKEKV